MALPQSIDPITLNISGKPAISTVAPTQITSAGGVGMPDPTVENVNRPVNPLLGALFGGLLGYATGQNLGLGGSGLTPINRPQTGTGSGGGSGGGGGGGTTSGGLPPVSGGSGTGSGNIGGMTGATSAIQTDASGNFVNTKTGEPVTPMGNNLFKDSQGNVLDENGNQVYPNYGGGSGSGSAITTETGNTATNAGGGYFKDQYDNVYNSDGVLIYANPNAPTRGEQTELGGGGYEPPSETRPNYLQDAQGNVYDENGTLIYYNPSNAIPGTNDGGGGYDPNVPETEQYYEDSSGNIFDYSGNLVLEYGNGYYYEPDTGNFYDSNFDVVGDDFSAYQDFFGIPTYGSGNYDDYDFSDLFDYGNYTSGSTTYIKDGGSVRSGLATPLFRKGGSVPKFEDGGFINQVVANQMPQSVSTTLDEPMTTTSVNQPMVTSGLQDTSNNPSFLDSILGFARNNPIMTGAGIGALLTAALNSGAMAIPTNKGVDMTALGRLTPRTTPTGPTRFVPYSEYGTPTTPYDYSQLYANLGVSPFGAGAGALSPSATPTTSASAQPVTAPTTPTGGLPTVTAPIAPSAPQYFQDADGNVYNANGDLVYDTTTGTTTDVAQQQTVSPSNITQASVAPMSGLAVTTPEASSSSYYSYGSEVDPTQVLNSKKGGEISKFSFGGLSRAEGGSPHSNPNIPTTASESHNPNVPIVQGRQDYRKGAYVQGAGDGQSDDIPAMLADGEYVIDAETVAQLGNGSNKAGAKMLDEFRENIRAHKRSAPTHKIPPKSKSPLAYLKGAK